MLFYGYCKIFLFEYSTSKDIYIYVVLKDKMVNQIIALGNLFCRATTIFYDDKTFYDRLTL